MSPSNQDHCGSHPPTRSTEWADVGDALIDGLAGGLQENVPGAVGIVVKSFAACLSLAGAHLLGVSIAEFAVSAGVGTTAPRLGGIGRLLRGHVRSK